MASRIIRALDFVKVEAFWMDSVTSSFFEKLDMFIFGIFSQLIMSVFFVHDLFEIFGK
jgi:hypothetical protein